MTRVSKRVFALSLLFALAVWTVPAQQPEGQAKNQARLENVRHGKIKPGNKLALLIDQHKYDLHLLFTESKRAYAKDYRLRVKRHGRHGVLTLTGDLGIETAEFMPDGSGVKILEASIHGNDIVVRVNDNSKQRTVTFTDALNKIRHHHF